MTHAALLLLASILAAEPTDGPTNGPVDCRPFAIRVVDAHSGRGVPLVELRTVHQVRYLTDSQGYVAFDEPGLMHEKVFFSIRSHGYEYPADGFGNRGVRLLTTPGGSALVKLRRINVAERLYRVTGAGIYGDSVRLGEPVPTARPVLNGRVLGSDSVINAIYRGRLYWFWGDTNRPSYPLGNFHVPGAISTLPAEGGLDPSVGVDLRYFEGDDGFARPTARLPGEGPTWLSSLVVLPDADGREQMFAHYVKIRNFLEVYQWGLVRFDHASKQFVGVETFPLDAPIHPEGAHPIVHTGRDGQPYVYFAHPFPHERVPATAEALSDWTQYEAYTPLLPDSTRQRPKLDRDADGKLRYAWRRGVPAMDRKMQDRLISQGTIRPEEAIRNFRDSETDRPIKAHRGSVYFNDYRNRWVMIFTETGGGPSQLGEVYYAEADDLTGPWPAAGTRAKKIVTHDDYSFYNPKHHPMFDQQGGRIIYFEGTYTKTFSAAKEPTPRYDYNQIMYRLDLSDPRLGLPAREK
ncbi:MAG: hypothetical protein V3R99_02505 [Thermoguttaceae bacterium]